MNCVPVALPRVGEIREHGRRIDMAPFKELCAVGGVPPGTMKGFKVGDLDVLVANVEGTFYAVEGICPHMSGYLAKGRLEGSAVVCPVHGARYDMKTGKVTKDIPWIMKRMSKSQPRQLATYLVRVEGGTVSVEDPGTAAGG
jgi:3-phenylpropionate/trans-cinnamate dioxygenase ferredoxin subunit